MAAAIAAGRLGAGPGLDGATVAEGAGRLCTGAVAIGLVSVELVVALGQTLRVGNEVPNPGGRPTVAMVPAMPLYWSEETQFPLTHDVIPLSASAGLRPALVMAEMAACSQSPNEANE